MNPMAWGVLTISDLSDHNGVFTIVSESTDKKLIQNKITKAY